MRGLERTQVWALGVLLGWLDATPWTCFSSMRHLCIGAGVRWWAWDGLGWITS
ncbi:hypothetical protein [Desulfosporosinus sp. BG]|uniref:hypothetical protein n=1 Tax=Desulfosporosinus sp. BG TaxID=1633135 RepID=UPI000858225E|nr:hypothetical protein [Desulfosporosinus sp. BG]ODA40175.1 hypothetical protein DSBG_3032 [Desulfosporosinus sp. BG]